MERTNQQGFGQFCQGAHIFLKAPSLQAGSPRDWGSLPPQRESLFAGFKARDTTFFGAARHPAKAGVASHLKESGGTSLRTLLSNTDSTLRAWLSKSRLLSPIQYPPTYILVYMLPLVRELGRQNSPQHEGLIRHLNHFDHEYIDGSQNLWSIF